MSELNTSKHFIYLNLSNTGEPPRTKFPLIGRWKLAEQKNDEKWRRQTLEKYSKEIHIFYWNNELNSWTINGVPVNPPDLWEIIAEGPALHANCTKAKKNLGEIQRNVQIAHTMTEIMNEKLESIERVTEAIVDYLHEAKSRKKDIEECVGKVFSILENIKNG